MTSQALNPVENFLGIYFDFSWQKSAVRAVVQTAFAVKNESSQFFFDLVVLEKLLSLDFILAFIAFLWKKEND